MRKAFLTERTDFNNCFIKYPTPHKGTSSANNKAGQTWKQPLSLCNGGAEPFSIKSAELKGRFGWWGEPWGVGAEPRAPRTATWSKFVWKEGKGTEGGRKGDGGGTSPPRLPHPPDPFSFSCRLLPQPFLPASLLISLLCLLLSVPAAVPGVAAAVAAGAGPAHSPLPLLPSAVYHSGLLRPTGRRHLGPASPLPSQRFAPRIPPPRNLVPPHRLALRRLPGFSPGPSPPRSPLPPHGTLPPRGMSGGRARGRGAPAESRGGGILAGQRCGRGGRVMREAGPARAVNKARP